MAWSWVASLFSMRASSSSSRLASSLLVAIISRSLTKARMISTLTAIARGDRSTEESIATPCSVKAYGGWRRPPQDELEITDCDLKLLNF
jgi:hypothetical protein